MYTKRQSREIKKLRSYEQYIEGYSQWKKDRECHKSQKATDEKK